MVAFEYEILLIAFVIYLIVSPLLVFIPWYIWWHKHDPKRQYNCFSLAQIAYFKYNYPFYLIFNNLKGPSRFADDWWVFFLTGIMGGEGKGMVSDDPNKGLCTPKTLCESLIPRQYPIGELPVSPSTKWPTSITGWRKLLMAWVGLTTAPKTYKEYLVKINPKKWSDPNNFLNDWGIAPSSPIVAAFITTWSTFGNDVVEETAIHPLLGFNQSGLGTGTRGWMGFIQDGSNTFGSIDKANRAVWSTEQPPHILEHQKSKCAVAGVASGAVNGAMGGAFAGHAIAGGLAKASAEGAIDAAGEGLAPETGGISLVAGAILGALVGSAIGGTMSAWQGHCL